MIPRTNNRELERRLQTACLLIITAILAGAAAYWLRAILIPFVLAVLFYQLFAPMVSFLTLRCRIPHLLSIAATLVLAVAILFLTSALITNSVTPLLRSSAMFVTQLDEYMNAALEKLPMFEDRFRLLIQKQIDQFGESLGTFVKILTNSIIYMLSQSTVVLIFLMFMLLGSPPSKEPLPGIIHDIDRKVKNYLQMKTAISLAIGLIVGSVHHVLGIELAFVFGLLVFVLNFIPSVGSLIATLLPIPIILVTPGMTLGVGLAAVIVPAIFQFVIGNIIEPKLMGDTLNLSPVALLLSLAIWASLWGGVGALLAVPITAVIQILCERLEFTRPISALLKGDFVNFLGSYEKRTDVSVASEEKPKALESTEGDPESESKK